VSMGGVNVDGTVGGGGSGDRRENVGRLHNNDIVTSGGGSGTRGGTELNLKTNANGGAARPTVDAFMVAAFRVKVRGPISVLVSCSFIVVAVFCFQSCCRIPNILYSFLRSLLQA
jgi:hypothetical protein